MIKNQQKYAKLTQLFTRAQLYDIHLVLAKSILIPNVSVEDTESTLSCNHLSIQ